MFLFKPSIEVEINFADKDKRNIVQLRREKGQLESLFVFTNGDSIQGTVHIKVPPGKPIEHQGIKIEFLGQIELFYDRGNHFEFISLVRDLEPVGSLTESKDLPFIFENTEKPFDSYNGINVRLRYLLKVTINRGYLGTVIKETDIWVVNYSLAPEVSSNIKVEVGIEDSVHIEFEYNKSKFHLKDAIIGKVYFILVRVKVKMMEIALVKKEITGSGQNTYNESETIAKYEIMDGTPVKGESIPIRLFLSGCNNITPSYRAIHNKFSVKYFINIIIIDEQERKYFKQQEIGLWRKFPKKSKINKLEISSTDLSISNSNFNANVDPSPSSSSKEPAPREEQ